MQDFILGYGCGLLTMLLLCRFARVIAGAWRDMQREDDGRALDAQRALDIEGRTATPRLHVMREHSRRERVARRGLTVL